MVSRGGAPWALLRWFVLPVVVVLGGHGEKKFTIWAQTHFGILDLAVLDLDLRDKKEN